MSPRVSEDEKKIVLLRTSTDVMLHCLNQLICCAQTWPEYQADATEMEKLTERMVAHAREFGYVVKARR